MKLIALVVIIISISFEIHSQVDKGKLPIIDMHLHAGSASGNGPPPTGYCAPPVDLPNLDPSNSWQDMFYEWLKNPDCDNPVWGPLSDKELMEETLKILDKYNIYAMTCGQFLDDYIDKGGQRIIPGLDFSMSYGGSPEEIYSKLSSGRYRVFGEIGIQYDGISPSDSIFDPYLEIAEKLDLPVGIHMGPGPPGAPYLNGLENYRARLFSPLLIEEALIRHPKLRVYIMHAGWPMIDDLLAILWTYPQVYIDIGLICYAVPRTEFYSYLKRIVEAGFGKRVLFGSDQMNWPQTIVVGIETIENAVFLSDSQKRDILYNNAARFLRLSDEETALHYNK